MSRKVIVWFRQDLRIHDNEALRDAMLVGDEILPVYVFDYRLFDGETSFGFKKTDSFRAKFLLECVIDLKSNLKKLGLDLAIRVGKPEDEVFELAKLFKSSWTFCNRERTQEELEVQDSLEKSLWSIGQEIRYSRGKMLFYTADLPFPVTHTPDVFNVFRKEVEKIVDVREPLDLEGCDNPKLADGIDLGEMPSLQSLGYCEEGILKSSGSPFYGGENAGLDRLNYYLWETRLVSHYKDTRNGMMGLDYSSKFSPWLAHGCLSPKTIYHELKKYEEINSANDSTYWLFLELMWRDFFRLMGKKHGNRIFQRGGIKGNVKTENNNNTDLFRIWSEGRTGVPIVDANMKELNATGFMSNRGRQNVANFLVNDLKVNWLMGAEYFESLLVDYDSCSNYGNWNYIAGVGNDPRENRYFSTIAQSRRYDPDGVYLSHWLPSLKELCPDRVHSPSSMSDEEQAELNFILGKDYPKACVRLKDHA